MGKQLIVYVIGLSLLMGYALLNLNKKSLDSQDTYTLSYGKSIAHNIAVAGANIGTHLCLNDTSYSTNLTNQPFNGGTFDMLITDSGDSTRITSIGRVSMRYYDYTSGAWKTEMRDTVISTLRRIYFSKYAYFSDDENFNYLTTTSNTVPSPGVTTNVWKITGDSLLGPSHTNGQWNLYNSPYFGSKVTGNSSPNLGGSGTPTYSSGNQWGLSITRPVARLDDIESAASSGGKLWTNSSTSNQDVGLTFMSNGNVRVKIPWNTGATKDTTYGSINSLAPNGVIGVKSIDVRVTGTYNGKATVLARTGSSPYKGNIWLQGNLVAADNPYTNPNSDDMMGLVAERMAYIATTGISRNGSSQTYLDAAVYCHNGILAVENYNTVPVSGRFNLIGGATMKGATVFGTFSGSTLVSGMLRTLRYDSRFLSQSPPSFPFANKCELVSWWEN